MSQREREKKESGKTTTKTTTHPHTHILTNNFPDTLKRNEKKNRKKTSSKVFHLPQALAISWKSSAYFRTNARVKYPGTLTKSFFFFWFGSVARAAPSFLILAGKHTATKSKKNSQCKEKPEPCQTHHHHPAGEAGRIRKRAVEMLEKSGGKYGEYGK